jgi:L-rhamnose mutarotase
MKRMLCLWIPALLSGCCNMPEQVTLVKQAAYVARLPKENMAAVRSICSGLDVKDGRGGIYLREIDGEAYLFIYSEEVAFFEAVEKYLGAGTACPLPVAKRNGRLFEPMERVFYEAGAVDRTPVGSVMRIAMFTELKPEKEKDYRLLHDNPWPDVIAAIQRANFRHFSIFLEEIDGRICLFGWLEYVGADIAADDAINKKDPASIRWWKETDACQIAPPDASGGMWGGMEELVVFE